MQGHYLLGLRILHMLVAEFNQPTSGRTMTLHRKLAVAFRDASLLKVFQIAIAAMQQLQGNASADEKLREQVRCSHHQSLHQVKAIVFYSLLSLLTPWAARCESEWCSQCICILISFHPHHCFHAVCRR